MMLENQTLQQMLINGRFLTLKNISYSDKGVVWCSYDCSSRVFVTAKEIARAYAEPEHVDAFFRWFTIAKNLSHENLLRPREFWYGSNGYYFILSDYVPGSDLRYFFEACRSSGIPVPWELAAYIGVNVLRALDYSFRQSRKPGTERPYSVVYDEVPPENVILSYRGDVMLKCGIFAGASGGTFAAHELLRDPYYPRYGAPGKGGDPDIRDNNYSVGLLLFELLGGPGFDRSDTALFRNALSNPPRLEAVKPVVPAALYAVLTKAMAPEISERFPTPFAFLQELKAVLVNRQAEVLKAELRELVHTVLFEEITEEQDFIERMAHIDLEQVRNFPELLTVDCVNATPKEAVAAAAAEAPAEARPEKHKEKHAGILSDITERIRENIEKVFVHDEAKGKTVFEEVGDWFFLQFLEYKRKVITAIAAVLVALVLICAGDIMFGVSPLGKWARTLIFPPNIFISTIPPGADIQLVRGDTTVFSVKNAEKPVELRLRSLDTYVVVATKKGFNPVRKAMRVEGKVGGRAAATKIEIQFDFPLEVDSRPSNAAISIDGSTVGTTPWKGQLVAGPHTIKLQKEGFEPLGSTARERKDGRCNIDFTKPTVPEMFGDIDRVFWKFNLRTVKGEAKFYLTGTLFKRITINSDPDNMIVFDETDNNVKGSTPLNVPLTAGLHRLKFIDPRGTLPDRLYDITVNEQLKDAVVTVGMAVGAPSSRSVRGKKR